MGHRRYFSSAAAAGLRRWKAMHTLLRVAATDADGQVGACGPCFEAAHASRLLPTGVIRLPISGKPEIGGPPQHEGCDLRPHEKKPPTPQFHPQRVGPAGGQLTMRSAGRARPEGCSRAV